MNHHQNLGVGKYKDELNAPRAIDWIKYLSSIELEFHFPSNVQSLLANMSAKMAIEAKSKTIFVSKNASYSNKYLPQSKLK